MVYVVNFCSALQSCFLCDLLRLSQLNCFYVTMYLCGYNFYCSYAVTLLCS